MNTSLWILCVQIGSISAAYYQNGYWNFNRKLDCNQRSVDSKLLCDGTKHCHDGTDEENCKNCNETVAFHCRNDRCIPNHLYCDGYDDCWDGSDEWKCSENRFDNSEYNVPTTLHQIDASKQKIMELSNEINSKGKFAIPMISFRADQSNWALDGQSVIFEHMRSVVFYVPGFMTNDLNDGIRMKNALVDGTDDVDCVILVDWRLGACGDHVWWEQQTDYTDYNFVVTKNVPVVSYFLASFINEKIPKHVRVHLIGFSLGGQISGLAARTLTKETGRTIERISAIDPSGPIFEYALGSMPLDPKHTLRKTDAAFVDIIHASPELGMVKEAGDIDIYMYEIDCDTPMCLHYKALDVYIASITYCSQITCPEKKRDGNRCRVDDASELSSLGYLANLYDGRGRYAIQFFVYGFLEGEKSSTGICSDWLNVNLPAKSRVCQKPPAATSGCRQKPYLSMCQEKCDIRTVATSTCVGDGKSGVIWSGRRCLRPISCMNEDGNEVDYFVAYKMPNSFDYIYGFKSSNLDSIEWKKGSHPVSSIKSAIGATLTPIYEQVEPITFITWNDDPPFDSRQPFFYDSQNIDPFGNGFSKGVMAYTKTGGFLLSHSVPRFPPNPNYTSRYGFPESGKRFAQIAICVTSEKQESRDKVSKEIEALLDLMIRFKPQVYASSGVHGNWPLALINKFDKVLRPSNLQLNETPTAQMFYGKSPVTIHSFGRSNVAEFKDIFKILTEQYETAIVAQARPNQYNPLSGSWNAKYSIEYVDQIKIWEFYGIEWIEWSHMDDNSKWIVSKSKDKPVVCIGDLNRTRNTMQRGGMFICIEDEHFFQKFNDRVTYRLEDCDVRRS